MSGRPPSTQEQPPGPAPARSTLSLRQRLWLPDAYGILLVMILVSLFSAAVLGDQRWGRAAAVAIQAGTLLFALRTSRAERRVFRVALVLVVLSFILAALSGAMESGGLGPAAIAVGGILALVTILVVVGRLASHPQVTGSTVLGALCVYLLIGILFSYVYGFLQAVDDEALFAQTEAADSLELTYFSFVTLATVGYGDLTPATHVGRTLAFTEAVTGQLYLVTVVALVVSNIGQTRQPRERRPKG